MAVLTEQEKRKRLAFTCGVGQGVRIINADGSEQRVEVQSIHRDSDPPVVWLAVDSAKAEQRGGFIKRSGEPGVVAGDSVVTVGKIGVDGHHKCQLQVSAPHDTCVAFDKGQ